MAVAGLLLLQRGQVGVDLLLHDPQGHPGGPVLDPTPGGPVTGRTASRSRKLPLNRPLPGEAVLTGTGTGRPAGGTTVPGGRPPLPITTPTGGKPPLTPAAALLQIAYGVRVPTFVISPWTMRGKGPRLVLDHCSILKSVLARFWGGEKPFLSDRVNASHSFDAFLTEAKGETV